MKTLNEQKAIKLAIAKNLNWAVDFMLREVEVYADDIFSILKCMLKIERKQLSDYKINSNSIIAIDNLWRIWE